MSRSKGVREMQQQRLLLVAADRARGLTLGQLMLKYNLDKSNIRRLLKKIDGKRGVANGDDQCASL